MKNYGKFVGYFFISFGVLGLIGFVIELLEANNFSFDFIRGLISILIGRGLLRNNNNYRIWAIIICGFSVISSIIWLVIEIIQGTGIKTLSSFDIFELPATIFVALYFLFFGTALFILLHPKTRKYYTPRESPLRKQKLITILKATNSAQILVAKSLLESADIPCFEKKEMIQDFFPAGHLGTGLNISTGSIELQVISENAGLSREILKEIIIINPDRSNNIIR